MSTYFVCLHCMTTKPGDGLCPQCGVDDRQLPYIPNTLPAGSILRDKYLIGRLLGAGGFGNTYLALDLVLHTKVAVKEFLPKELAGRERNSIKVSIYSGNSQAQFMLGLEKFLDEARVLARFKTHPNIVSISDFFQEFGTAFIAMDYVEGITFKEYLQRKGGQLSFAETFTIIAPVLDALNEVHAEGLLHRDISPDNIYVTRDGQVKLLDFGAARQAIGEVSKSLSVILKPGYAPGEQYFSKGNQGSWTDIYAVAATIYHAITGVLPPESLERMESDTLRPPSELGVSLPTYIERALLKGLSVRSSERFQTTNEFCTALSGQVTVDADRGDSLQIRSFLIEGKPFLHASAMWVLFSAIFFQYDFYFVYFLFMLSVGFILFAGLRFTARKIAVQTQAPRRNAWFATLYALFSVIYLEFYTLAIELYDELAFWSFERDIVESVFDRYEIYEQLAIFQMWEEQGFSSGLIQLILVFSFGFYFFASTMLVQYFQHSNLIQKLGNYRFVITLAFPLICILMAMSSDSDVSDAAYVIFSLVSILTCLFYVIFTLTKRYRL